MTNHPNRSVLGQKSAFVRSLLDMTPDQLAHQYLVTGEVMNEEEDHAQIAAGKRMLEVIDAVGKFLHGIRYEDASDRAAQ